MLPWKLSPSGFFLLDRWCLSCLLEGGLLEGWWRWGGARCLPFRSLLKPWDSCLPTTPSSLCYSDSEPGSALSLSHNLLPVSFYSTQLLTIQKKVLRLRKLKLGKVKHLPKQQVTGLWHILLLPIWEQVPPMQELRYCTLSLSSFLPPSHHTIKTSKWSSDHSSPLLPYFYHGRGHYHHPPTSHWSLDPACSYLSTSFSIAVVFKFPNVATLQYSSSHCGDTQPKKLFLLLLHNYNFASVMNCNINISYATSKGLWPTDWGPCSRVTREILLKSKLDLATSWLKTLCAFQLVLRIKATFYVALQEDLAAGYFSGSISTHSLPLWY